MPWLMAIEQEMDAKLFRPVERKSYFICHDVETLTRGNSAAQLARDNADLATGVASINEVRVRRGQPPLDDQAADYHWISVNNLQAIETMGGEAARPAEETNPMTPEAAPVADVQATALNGAQIASLLAVVQQVALGSLPPDAARGVIAASFPVLSSGQIDAILGPLAGGDEASPGDPSTAPPDASGEALEALRGVLLDPVGRMLRRETGSVRKAAAKERFDEWIETFYQTHSSVVTDAIGPAIRALSAATGRTIDPLVLAAKMGIESRRQLRELMVCHPPDEMPGVVDRLCVNWESGRAAAIVDELLGARP
jgi:hypothetical protein